MYLCIFSLPFFSFQIECSGVFELKLKTFLNANGKDNQNLCCSGRSDPTTGKCIGSCKTRFRVCLKHYQAKIDTNSPCTFGDVSTPVVGDNNVDLTQQQNNTSINPIQFPFDFTWPVSTHTSYFLYTIIIKFEMQILFKWKQVLLRCTCLYQKIVPKNGTNPKICMYITYVTLNTYVKKQNLNICRRGLKLYINVHMCPGSGCFSFLFCMKVYTVLP